MDKLILICFCFALLTSHLQYVSSEESGKEDEERPVLSKDLLDSFTPFTLGQQNQNLLPALLSTDNELPKSINDSITISDVTSSPTSTSTNNEDKFKLPPIFIDFESDIEKKSDVNRSSASNTHKNSGLALPEKLKPFLPLGNTSAGDETTDTDATNKDKDDWFYQEKNDDEEYTENEGNKDDSEEYKDEDWDDETEDDFDESKSHLVDELAKKNKQPTAPTRMVLFYTWMIVAVLLIVVGVSTYQSRCRGFKFFGTKASNPKDDRKRLMEHEFV